MRLNTFQINNYGIILLATLMLTSCASSVQVNSNITQSEAFIDAFYSFDKVLLERLLVSSQSSAPIILYYQGWAEGGNYKIVERKVCEDMAPGMVSCSITVTDDPMQALGIDFNVTDTFNITFLNKQITSVDTTSNDLQVYHDAGAWVMKELPELITEPCRGFFDGGPTPADCARAMTKGYTQFAASKDFPGALE
ncbi:MAG: hypothetical protein ACJAVI_006226 [Candidatus Azotimanducaceae bacterium]|jgi:hypothetical protein